MALLLTYSNRSSFVSSFSIIPPVATTTITTTTTSTPPLPKLLTPLQQWNSNSNLNSNSNSNSFFSSTTSSSTTSGTSSSKYPLSSSALLLLADNNGVTDTSTTSSSAVGSSVLSKNNNNNSNNNNLVGTNKVNFLNSLDTMDTLNDATKERTTLLNKMISENNTETKTNSHLQSASPNPIAVGKWKVIYAPHISTAANILNGKFDVQYDLFYDEKEEEDGSASTAVVVSHAYYDFPIIGKGYLSVSGTYGIDFNKAWIKPISKSKSQEEESQSQPYASLKDVPDSLMKTIINEIGKRAFVESVAVFPVSFLDSNMIVFEFQLFGTKICACKQ
ncbi:hypothetical protein FRACYDRAFT_196982 [Fragilariopsis cylindrus CCMP1102]|uniref:Uncharacterized protein n=1 Tax=Fragilariopsis cylindrus CCMP1102 TaxID=635003 RepID=A0A1E7EPU3_9STRA|nr:hypothetical protein FRACYDRAFT_196982 [Fragilariopsis cylindrus CCMP1102]|eukprot:OEU07951.1 hypothetical protein FRACYDRAFT_196982 [Fragilariopsis cylindrus CCMP1102]